MEWVLFGAAYFAVGFGSAVMLAREFKWDDDLAMGLSMLVIMLWPILLSLFIPVLIWMGVGRLVHMAAGGK